MNTRESVIVYAPAGTGKHTDTLRRAFGLDTVIANAQPGADDLPATGALLLTTSPDVHLICGGTIAAIDYDAAIRYAHRRRRQRLN